MDCSQDSDTSYAIFMAVDYAKIALESRKKALDLIYRAQTSHIGSVLSCADLATVLFERMDLEKDVFILSKGWAAVLVYYHLARKGLIPEKDLDRYCREGEEKYIGLIEPIGGFGALFAGGSMQMGAAASVGFALSQKMKGVGRTVCLESDGAMAGGMIWESAVISSHHALNNLTWIFDCNGWQATGETKEVLNMEPVRGKFEAFGWEVTEIDGHDFQHIEDALLKETSMPHCILAKTVKGRGVSFMEADGLLWHYKNIPEDLYTQAREELV